MEEKSWEKILGKKSWKNEVDGILASNHEKHPLRICKHLRGIWETSAGHLGGSWTPMKDSWRLSQASRALWETSGKLTGHLGNF